MSLLLAILPAAPAISAETSNGPACRAAITYAHETNREATVRVEENRLREAADLNQSTLDRIRQALAVCPGQVHDLLDRATSLVRTAHYVNSQGMSGALPAQNEAGWTLQEAHRKVG
ncbi:hypothetical protein [Spirillospora sp. NPDC047279]|uniref:hypothetical protein n=1 Tax=Spirillospora sp. NPDC047279 TaxID=3155478 RepID=UPI0033DC2A64